MDVRKCVATLSAERAEYLVRRAGEGVGISEVARELKLSRYWLYLCLHKNNMFEEYQRKYAEAKKRKAECAAESKRIARWRKRVGEKVARFVEERFGRVVKTARYFAYVITEQGLKVTVRRPVLWEARGSAALYRYMRYARLSDPSVFYVLLDLNGDVCKVVRGGKMHHILIGSIPLPGRGNRFAGAAFDTRHNRSEPSDTRGLIAG
ncbi:MAG: hypothetical protein QXY39_05565 [Thermofilaceae archaeon]